MAWRPGRGRCRPPAGWPSTARRRRSSAWCASGSSCCSPRPDRCPRHGGAGGRGWRQPGGRSSSRRRPSGRSCGVERLQLRWLALAAAVTGVLAAVVLVGFAVGATAVPLLAAGICMAILPLATGAAIMRYRLYDLDRIISRTLAYGLLTLLLGGAYAGIVLGLGQLLGQGRSLVVAAATLAL